MPLTASRRQLLALEAHMWEHINACINVAMRRLTDAELEQLHTVFNTYPAQIDRMEMLYEFGLIFVHSSAILVLASS